MNRAERRAAKQGKRLPGTAPKVKYYRVPLTPHEMDLVAEGLDALRRTMGEDLDEDKDAWTEPQKWAFKRAGQIRDILQATLEGRPYHDGDPDRLAPELPTDVLA